MENKTLQRFKLDNEICLITGGAGLLGTKHAEAILDAGGTVVLTDIIPEKIEEKISVLSKKYPNKIFGYKLDITQESDIKNTLEKIEREVGKISILINNAANNPHVKEGGKNFSRLENFPLETWQDDIAVGLTGAFLMSKYTGQKMAGNNKGVILNIASDLGVIAPDQRIYRKDGVEEDNQPVKPVTYSVVKHGLIGLTKYLATYWPDKNVRVNSVSFGGVYNNQPQDFVDKLTKLIPLGRMADIEEYKSTIVFLCSEASSYMTGSNLIIDGGRTVW